MPALDLSKLVKGVVPLTGKVDVRREFHPLDVGLKKDQKYFTLGGSPIVLPGRGQGLHRLQTRVESPIAGVPEEYQREAYVRLLSTAIFTHRVPGHAHSWPSDVPQDADALARLRSVLLAAVFRGANESFENGIFSPQRFACVGVLSVLTDANEPKKIADAWLDVEAASSTSGLVAALERLAGPDLTAPPNSRPLTMLVAEDLWYESQDVEQVIRRLAYLSGTNPSVHIVGPKEVSAVRTQLRDALPSRLIMFGGGLDEALATDFVSRRGTAELYRPHVEAIHDVVDWLRTELPRLRGVGPALMLNPEPLEASSMPVMPIAVASRCAHHNGTPYVLDQTTGWWWTRDRDQHGHSIFKTYVLRDDALDWDADRDVDGNVIEGKNKGNVLLHIPMSWMKLCSFPASHLSGR
ncbi:hypothetical protein [Microbacterium maritypicum]|uniref:hypothetical protein n=1 Tax=Microbacterium maritypicum TaxID=33918 RepID=UPI003A9568CF